MGPTQFGFTLFVPRVSDFPTPFFWTMPEALNIFVQIPSVMLDYTQLQGDFKLFN